jgi:hypothetical protein
VTPDQFDRAFEDQISTCRNILHQKADEYAPAEDRLHNFRLAAGLQGITMREALAGMMAKHTISLYDMCMGDDEYPVTLWLEKLTDNLNYLFLLRAILEEEFNEMDRKAPKQ